MALHEDLADILAKDTIEAAENLADERLIDEVASQLGASSTTMEEAFMTSIRVRLAEKRARLYLQNKIKSGGSPPE
jgi:hypothetical protein